MELSIAARERSSERALLLRLDAGTAVVEKLATNEAVKSSTSVS